LDDNGPEVTGNDIEEPRTWDPNVSIQIRVCGVKWPCDFSLILENMMDMHSAVRTRTRLIYS